VHRGNKREQLNEEIERLRKSEYSGSTRKGDNITNEIKRRSGTENRASYGREKQ
jgi:hypothetical protein